MSNKFENLRAKIIKSCLEWRELIGVAPHITSAISEYDAMKIVGMSEEEILNQGKNKTAVQRGYDFVYKGVRYQVKANRPSGRKGSFVTLTSKPKNYNFDKLIWILYDSKFLIQEALVCDVNSYKEQLDNLKQVRPVNLRKIGMKMELPKTSSL